MCPKFLSLMERAAVQAAVESVRHPPALYWGVASAAAVCSLYGTFALAKRSNSERNRNRSNPGVAFKRLRRKYAEKLRPLFEDLVYFTMFILNLLVGVFYWIVDCFLDPRVSSSQKIVVSNLCVDPHDLRTVDDAEALEVLTRPRRGEIKRLRIRWAWVRSKSKKHHPRQRCECWGWRVKDLEPVGSEAHQIGLEGRHSSKIQSENKDLIAEIGEPSSQILQQVVISAPSNYL